jgi:hypothetical protein
MSLSPLKHYAASILLKLILLIPSFWQWDIVIIFHSWKNLLNLVKAWLGLLPEPLVMDYIQIPYTEFYPNECGNYVCKYIHAHKALHQILWSLQPLN